MEKIKTPIMAKIQEIKDSISADINILDSYIDREEESQILSSIESREIQITLLESLLPTERDMMIAIHCSGQVCVKGSSNIKIAESCLKEKYHLNILKI